MSYHWHQFNERDPFVYVDTRNDCALHIPRKSVIIIFSKLAVLVPPVWFITNHILLLLFSGSSLAVEKKRGAKFTPRRQRNFLFLLSSLSTKLLPCNSTSASSILGSGLPLSPPVSGYLFAECERGRQLDGASVTTTIRFPGPFSSPRNSPLHFFPHCHRKKEIKKNKKGKEGEWSFFPTRDGRGK